MKPRPDSLAPIGMFDSGVGGLSVFREISQLLPGESITYVADHAWCPYGPRPEQEVRNRSQMITRFLIEKGVKLIVVACNTATATAISALRKDFSELRFVGMEPAIKPAAAQSETGVIGVLATENTFQGQHFQETKRRHAYHVDVLIQPGVGLVDLVESGKANSPEARKLLQSYLLPMVQAGADQLVLGCTHYPFLSESIKAVVGDKLSLVDAGPAVARRVAQVLNEEKLTNTSGKEPRHTFFQSGPGAQLQNFLKDILEMETPVQALPEMISS